MSGDINSASCPTNSMNGVVPSPMAPAVAKVLEYRQETHDTYTLIIERPASVALSHGVHRGQFNMLYAFGIGEVPISLSGDPHETSTLTHTIRAVGAVTNALGQLRAGDFLGVRGTYGNSWPMDDAKGKDVVIVAGGNGLAPLRPAIYHLLRHRNEFANVWIVAGFRSPADILFAEQISEWSRRNDLECLTTVDFADSTWHGRVGVVTSLLSSLKFDPQNTMALICGPEIMMRFTIRELKSKGIRSESIHLAMERNMQCAIGFCGHCQFGPKFVCMDGPVFRHDQAELFLSIAEA